MTAHVVYGVHVVYAMLCMVSCCSCFVIALLLILCLCLYLSTRKGGRKTFGKVNGTVVDLRAVSCSFLLVCFLFCYCLFSCCVFVLLFVVCFFVNV
jgi:hypothetical protein